MRIRVFISSVQKELSDERLALQILLSTDPFLSEHCVPILFDKHPAGLKPDSQAYLELLRSCHVYICIIWKEYGNEIDNLSATHHEYRLAINRNLPILVTIKGPNSLKRDTKTEDFIKEIKLDDHTYDRFISTVELQEKVRSRLIKHIKDTYDLEPSASQEQSAHLTIKIASFFERQHLDLLRWEDINMDSAGLLVKNADEITNNSLTADKIRTSLLQRGYLWKSNNQYYATAAGILLFAPDPSMFFPHCRVQIAAYSGNIRSATPIDHMSIRKSLPQAIDDAVLFIFRNTRHPLRVVGLKRIEVNEYPEEALREALVNALAHRDYEDGGRRVSIDIYYDRIEIASPGKLPGNLTLKKLKSGTAKARSRNPNISQALVFLKRMEERGTGIQRMYDSMLDHGLEKPQIEIMDEDVIVILSGPGDELDKIKTSSHIFSGLKPSVESILNDRQRIILEEVVRNGSVTSSWCIKTFGVVKDTAVRDINELKKLNLIESRGEGRGRHYVIKS